MFTFIMTLVGAFFGAVFGVVGVILYDRFKRPIPNYDFDFEKEILYQGTVQGAFGMLIPTTGHFPNYIRIENYSAAPLFNISTKIWFDTRKERLYYQTMEIAENLFDWGVEELSAISHIHAYSEDILLSTKGEKEVYEAKRKQGFFIPDPAMEKLKRLSPIKVEVEYTWEGKRGADIWLFDFSDENEVRFGMSSPTFWEKIKLIFKRIF